MASFLSLRHSFRLHVARARVLSGLLAVFPIPSIAFNNVPLKYRADQHWKFAIPRHAAQLIIARHCSLKLRQLHLSSCYGNRYTFYLLSLINNVPAITTAYYRQCLVPLPHPQRESLLCSTFPFQFPSYRFVFQFILIKQTRYLFERKFRYNDSVQSTPLFL